MSLLFPALNKVIRSAPLSNHVPVSICVLKQTLISAIKLLSFMSIHMIWEVGWDLTAHDLCSLSYKTNHDRLK